VLERVEEAAQALLGLGDGEEDLRIGIGLVGGLVFGQRGLEAGECVLDLSARGQLVAARELAVALGEAAHRLLLVPLRLRGDRLRSAQRDDRRDQQRRAADTCSLQQRRQHAAQDTTSRAG
jgi:hypothetical protein